MAVLGIKKGAAERAKPLSALPQTFGDKGFEIVVFTPDRDNLVRFSFLFFFPLVQSSTPPRIRQ